MQTIPSECKECNGPGSRTSVKGQYSCRTASASRPPRVAPRREPGHQRTSTPFPLSGAKLQMRARAGTMRPVRHRPAGQRGTILSPERMPDKMPLGASRSGQRLSRRAGGHFINISIYHVVTRSRPCGCPSAHHSANRLGRRPRRSPPQEAPFWPSSDRVVVRQVRLVARKPKASGA